MNPVPSRPPPEPKPKPKQAAWYRYTDAASLGIEIAVAVSLCAFVGRWLETNYTHWAPWTTLIFIGIGMGAAARGIIRTARNYKRQLAEDSGNDHDPGSPPPAA